MGSKPTQSQTQSKGYAILSRINYGKKSSSVIAASFWALARKSSRFMLQLSEPGSELILQQG
jgi:hypothetical protein